MGLDLSKHSRLGLDSTKHSRLGLESTKHSRLGLDSTKHSRLGLDSTKCSRMGLVSTEHFRFHPAVRSLPVHAVRYLNIVYSEDVKSFSLVSVRFLTPL